MDVFWFLISTSIMALFLRFISLHNPKVSIWNIFNWYSFKKV
jgi:hypothetical protein